MLARHGSLRDMQRGPPRRCSGECPAKPAPWSGTHALSQNSPRLRASQIDALAADLSHQRRAIPIGARPVWHGVDKYLVLIVNVGDNWDNTVNLLPTVHKVIEKYRHIVIRIRMRVAPRARSEQHHPFQPVTVDFVERGTEAFQDRIVGGCIGSDSVCRAALSHYRCI